MNLDWLAGFFDGEGGISVHPHSLTVHVSLTNRDKIALLSVLQEFPEGRIDSRQRNENWAEISEIRWNGKKAIPFLLSMENRCVVKKTQISLALRLISLVGNLGDNTITNLDERLRLAEEICSLNARSGKTFTQRRTYTKVIDAARRLGLSKNQLLQAVKDVASDNASKEGS